MSEDTIDRTAPPVRDWPALDLAGTDFDPVLTELMREGPVTRISLPNGEGWAWLVTRHDDVRMVTNDPRFGREAVMDRQVTRLAPHFIPARGAVGFLDPPDHTRLRRSVAAAFTARGVERVRSRSRGMLDELVDAMLRAGPPADLTEAVLSPFPIAVICELMGVPARRPAQHAHLDAADPLLVARRGGQRAGEARDERLLRRSDRPAVRQHRRGRRLAPRCRRGPGGGHPHRGGRARRPAPDRRRGGHQQQRADVLPAADPPELAEHLRSEPEIRPRAIDELLRWIPHRNAVGLSRIALEDVELRGVRIRAGDAVYVSYLAANRDPEVFPDPDTIDFSRTPNPHVSFGFGPHYCPGGMLARLESELLVDTLLDRVPGLKLAVPPEDVPFKKGALIRGPEALPVTW